VLSKIRTAESYGVLKNLLLTSLPAEGETGSLGYHLRDSLPLVLTLYPDVLSLSSDSLFSDVLVDVTKDLLDSNLLAMKEVLPYQQNFLRNAKRILNTVQQDENKWWTFSNWVPFIAKFNDKASNELVREVLTLKEVDAKYAAVLALIKNGQTVNAADIETVAEDKGYRKDLYEELKKLNTLKLFPAKYATQLKIAESEIYFLANEDDDEPSAINFIGERITIFMGKKQKFYLFKIDFSYEEESSSYLGITGPYLLSGKEIITSSKASGINWDEAYVKKKIDEQFKNYISQTEENLKERKQPDSNMK